MVIEWGLKFTLSKWKTSIFKEINHQAKFFDIFHKYMKLREGTQVVFFCLRLAWLAVASVVLFNNWDEVPH